MLIFSGASGEVSWRLTGNGSDEGGPLSPDPSPSRYVCSANGLLGVSTDGTDVVSLSR